MERNILNIFLTDKKQKIMNLFNTNNINTELHFFLVFSIIFL